MSKQEKLIRRFKSRPVDFTWNELVTLLKHLGFVEFTKGKTSGSRHQFFNKEVDLALDIHKPHPKSILKHYQVNEILNTLKIARLI